MNQNVLGPPELSGRADIEPPFQLVLAMTHNNDVVAPAYFSNQWLEFWIVLVCEVKLAHIPQFLDDLEIVEHLGELKHIEEIAAAEP